MGKPLVKTQALWRDRLERWRRGNKTDEEFAAIEGVKVSSLKWWRWRLSAADARREQAGRPAATSAPVRFVEVTPAPARPVAGGACHYEVVLRNGRVVRVPAGFEDAALARVLKVVDEVRR